MDEEGQDLRLLCIHGITAADLRHASTFKEIAGILTDLLRGWALVAYNLRIDVGFPECGPGNAETVRWPRRSLPATRVSSSAIAPGTSPPPPAGKDRAGVTAPHRHHDGGGADDLIGPRPREPASALIGGWVCWFKG